MLQWTPFSKPPKDKQLILVRLSQETTDIVVAEFSPRLLGGNTPGFYGWMPADIIMNAPVGYDPTFGDDKLCFCGHTYRRHFDTYDDMSPVGCKYCHGFEEGVTYREALEPPHNLNQKEWEQWWEDNKPLPSICSGFKEKESNAEDKGTGTH